MEPFHQILSYSDQLLASLSLHHEGEELIDLHWHDALEIIASMDSKIHVSVESHNYILEEHDVCIINSNEIHRGYPVNGYENDAISINFAPSFLKSYCPNYHNIYFSLRNSPDVRKMIVSDMEKLYEIEYMKTKPQYYRIRENELLHHILWLLLCHGQSNQSRREHNSSMKYHDRYIELITYIQEHYAENLTLESCANYISLSKEHLSREFKNYFGEGFKEYVTTARIVKAQTDLLHTDIPIVEIAIKHGFNDVRNYNRAFQQAFGVSPAKYRRHYRTQCD